MTICHENLYYAQKLQKQAHNKGVKARSYASSNKIWLNSKYIKTKQNWKLETKFFRPFQVLYFIQANLQAQTTKKVEDLQCFSCITTRARHY